MRQQGRVVGLGLRLVAGVGDRRARRRRRRSRRPRRRPARCGCGAARRRVRRTAAAAAAAGRAAPPRRRRPGPGRSSRTPTRTAAAGDQQLTARPGGRPSTGQHRRRRRAGRRPTTGERTARPRSPRRPASTATTSCRDAIQAGTTAARNALSSPKAAIAEQVRPADLERPELGVRVALQERARSSRADDDARARRPTTAPTAPSTTAAGEDRPGATAAAYRRWPRSGPGCATDAGRRPRTPGRPAAPPRSAPSPRSARGRRRSASGRPTVALTELRRQLGRAAAGARSPARDSTVAPIALSARTSSQETGAPPTSQVGRPSAGAARRAAERSPTTSGWVREVRSTRPCPTTVDAVARRRR